MVIYTATVSLFLFPTSITYLNHSFTLWARHHSNPTFFSNLQSSLHSSAEARHRLHSQVRGQWFDWWGGGQGGRGIQYISPLFRPSTATCMCISHLSCTIPTAQRRPRSRVTPLKQKTHPGCKNRKKNLKPFCITNYFTLLCIMFLHNFYQYV